MDKNLNCIVTYYSLYNSIFIYKQKFYRIFSSTYSCVKWLIIDCLHSTHFRELSPSFSLFLCVELGVLFDRIRCVKYKLPPCSNT